MLGFGLRLVSLYICHGEPDQFVLRSKQTSTYVCPLATSRQWHFEKFSVCFPRWSGSTASKRRVDAMLSLKRDSCISWPYKREQRLNTVGLPSGYIFIFIHRNGRNNDMRKCKKRKEEKKTTKLNKTRMWANVQRDGRPVEYRWRPLFNAANFGWRPLLEYRPVTLPRRETRWHFAKVPQSRQQISAATGLTFTYHIVRTCGGDVAV